MSGSLRIGSISRSSDPPETNRVAATEAAFESIYAEFADTIYRFCYRRLGDPNLAEDATSQVFTKAFAALPRFRGGSTRAWLFAIANNVIVDNYRSPNREDPLAAADVSHDLTPGPEYLAIANEQRHLIRSALGQLPESQRRIVELRLAGLTSAEIAQTLNQSVPAVKTAQTRAYSRLRSLLQTERQAAENDHAT